MDRFKDLMSWLLIYFPRKNGSASFSISLGGPWKWKFQRPKCSQRKPDPHLIWAYNLKSKWVTTQIGKSVRKFLASVSAVNFPTRTEAFRCLLAFHKCCRSGEVRIRTVKHGSRLESDCLQAYVGVSKVQAKWPSRGTATFDTSFFSEVGRLPC